MGDLINDGDYGVMARHELTNERAIQIMRDAVLDPDRYWGNTPICADDRLVPEKLRPLLQAVVAAVVVGQYSAIMPNRDDPAVLFWKRSAVEEIYYLAGELADPEVA